MLPVHSATSKQLNPSCLEKCKEIELCYFTAVSCHCIGLEDGVNNGEHLHVMSLFLKLRPWDCVSDGIILTPLIAYVY